jgi:hypothetical protein
MAALTAGNECPHAVCRRCDAVADVDCAVGDVPCLTTSDDQGYAIDEAEVAYWGLCPICSLSHFLNDCPIHSSGRGMRPRPGPNATKE